MDFLMAFPTHNQRFASSCCHLFDPCWFFSSSWLFQISELTDMVDLYFLFRATEFTRISKHSLEEFAAVGHGELRMAIHKNGFLLPLEGDAPKAGHQRFLVLATVNNHLQALSWPMLRLNGGFVLPCHLGDGRPVFACQGFEQRCLRYPVLRFEPSYFLSQEILLHYSSVLRLILAENAVIPLPYHLGPLCRFSTSHVQCTFLFNDFLWHS